MAFSVMSVYGFVSLPALLRLYYKFNLVSTHRVCFICRSYHTLFVF